MIEDGQGKIDVKKAVNVAREQARYLFEGEDLQNLALEEVEYDDTTDQWLVTLGYDSPHVITRKTGPNLFPTTEEEKKRAYKIFHIDAKNGKLVSMKIRNV